MTEPKKKGQAATGGNPTFDTSLHSIPSGGFLTERDMDKRPVLDVRGLGIDFGGLTAVDNFNLMIGRNEIAGLIGPNGAGKTTVFNLLTNVYQPSRGSILLDGVPTAGKKTYQVNRMGVARTFQNIRLFKDLTVIDNVKVGLHQSMNYRLPEALLRLPSYWKQEKRTTDEAIELLNIFHMSDLAGKQAGEGIAVLNFGRVIAKGTPDEIRNNPQVIEAYLGKKEG